MYLHIGGNYMVNIQSIVAFFKKHPKRSEKSNPLQKYYRPLIFVHTEKDTPVRSYIVTEEYIYASPLTLKTLLKRYIGCFSKIVYRK